MSNHHTYDSLAIHRCVRSFGGTLWHRDEGAISHSFRLARVSKSERKKNRNQPHVLSWESRRKSADNNAQRNTDPIRPCHPTLPKKKYK